MAFVTPTAQNNVPATNGTGAKERAPKTTQAYVNFYLPLKDGTRLKLFSDLTLRLYAEKRADVKLIELVKAGIIPTTHVNGMFELEISIARDENEDIEFDI